VGSIKLRGYWFHHGRENFNHCVHTIFRWSKCWTTSLQYWREAQNVYFGFLFDLIECLNIFWKTLSQILFIFPLMRPGFRVSMVCTTHKNSNIWLRLYTDFPFFTLRVLTLTLSFFSKIACGVLARKNCCTPFGKA
jgi:hypothetical protein